MTIWIFNKPNDEAVDFIFKSISKGQSRFGWSYIDSADLNILKNKSWTEMNDSEQDCWSRTNFLLQIDKNDWIVHVNSPKLGYCTAAIVIEKYFFDKNRNSFGKEYTNTGDYRHIIPIDSNSVLTFDRNDKNILPIISRRLKLQGHYWRIYHTDEFLTSINNLKNNTVKLTNNETVGEYFLKKDIIDNLNDISNLIHKHHPGKSLEKFIAKVFRRIPNVIEVIENGFGWKSDKGADLIVKYKTGLSISPLEKEETLVVQIKSFSGDHFELNAVKQIEEAIGVFKANAGMIITTANKTEKIEKEIDTLSKRIEKPILLISGNEVAKFVLKYRAEIIIDI